MSGCYAVFHKQLGDLLLLEPALNRLQAHHGDPVRVMTRAGHLPLLSLMPCARPQTGPALVWRSNLYCFDPLNKSAARSFFAPARVKRCILPEQREIQWFHRWLFGEIIVPELGDRYVAEYFWENTPVPTSHPFRPPQLLAPPPEWKPPGIGDGPFLLLNPTSGWRQKTWLPDRWAEVIRALAAEGAPRVILTSASTEWQVEHCRAIAEAASPHVQSLSSGTTLEQFLWLCANASMVLTADFSGDPEKGVVISGSSPAMVPFGLKAGMVIVALDGYRTDTFDQYLTIRELTEKPAISMVVWDGKNYRISEGTLEGRRFGVDLADYSR